MKFTDNLIHQLLDSSYFLDFLGASFINEALFQLAAQVNIKLDKEKVLIN